MIPTDLTTLLSLLVASVASVCLSSVRNVLWLNGLCSVLRPRQQSKGYMGDGFYRSKDPTNSI